MTLENLGNLGEFIAAVAVVVSLIYLALQIRQNTRSVRDSAFQGVVHTVAELTMRLGTNPQSIAILRRGVQSPDDLSKDEWSQFSILLHGIFNNYQNYYWMRERGLLDDSVWTPTVNNLRLQMKLPGFQTWWKRYPLELSTSFTEYVEREILGDGKG